MIENLISTLDVFDVPILQYNLISILRNKDINPIKLDNIKKNLFLKLPLIGYDEK